MKKIIIIIFALFLTSCLSTKKTIKNFEKQKEKIEIKKDSIQKVSEKKSEKIEVSNPISKKNSISLKTADSLTNAKINKALRNFSYKDKSGKNTVSARYDEKTMQLILEAFISGSQNKTTENTLDTETNTNTETTSEKKFEKNVEKYIKKIVIPWWGYLILIFLFRKTIFSILAFFLPQIRGIKTLTDLITPPEKK